MSKNLIENKRYTFTRYCRGIGKLGYQITQRRYDINTDAEPLPWDYVQITKKDLLFMLKKIEEDEE